MSPLALTLVATGAIAGTGVLALVLVRVPRFATFVAVLGALAGGVAGLWAALVALRSGFTADASTPWRVPGGSLVVGIDPLSAFFLAPLFVLGALCAVYGRSYLGPRPAQSAQFNLLLATMALVLVARQAMLFLVAWEAMTLLAYLLIAFDHGEPEVRRAGWVYLIASHVAVVVLLGLFLALSMRAGGSLDFTSFAQAWRVSSPGGGWILTMAVLGFGVKAGIVGLHVWLPEAHAAAPSHVSALMSAVMIKLGLYGILRTTLIVSPGPSFGAWLMTLGVMGAVLGIALALSQRDLKRILAYSSVENIGIVLVGVGLGFWAQSRGDARLSAMGFAGGFLHIWNHAAMKGLMFLGAGSVLYGTGTKDVERLGGLMGRMRWTGRAMVLGAVAIAGLPPLNGFTGEWLLYRGLTQLGISGSTPSNLLAMGGTAVLALVGGLAVACFVRLVGIVLLGTPRGDGAAQAHESPAAMTVPMWVLAGACIAGAFTAPQLVSVQGSVLAELHATGGGDITFASGFLTSLVGVNLALFLAILLAMVFVKRRVDRTQVTETWGCGYAAPTSRTQYSARGFSEFLTARVFPRWFQPQVHVHPPEGTFPVVATLASDGGDPLTRGAYEPLLVRAGHHFARLRFLQQGNLHYYLLYVFAALIGGLIWVVIRDWWSW